MENNNILLSICIPTYNESIYLDATIFSIVSQKEFGNGRIEIVITDNNSSDDTAITVHKYIKNFPNIRYYRNETNIGSTDNTVLAVKYSIGLFIKVSTASIMFNDGSLTCIIDYIKKYNNKKIQLYFSNICTSEDKLLNFKDFSTETMIFNTNYVTWGMWRDDLNDYINDYLFKDVYIPACYFNLKFSYKYDKVLLINKIFFKGQVRHPKYLLYGVFNVFYNQLLSIYNIYYDKNILKKNTIDELKNKIGFWMIPYIIFNEFKDPNYVFNNKENIKIDFINAYKKEKYFLKLYCKYLIEKMKYILRRYVKRKL